MMGRLNEVQAADAAQAIRETAQDLAGKGKWFSMYRALANSPATTEGYFALSRALGKGSLGQKAREGIAVFMAQRNRCDYCMTAHTALARSLGYDDAAIREARRGQGGADGRSEAAVRLAKALLDARDGEVPDAELAAARAAGLTDADMVEVAATVAINLFTNLLNHLHHGEIDLPMERVHVDPRED